MDEVFAEYFKNVQQVFLYINDECNIYCKHCIYKPNITFNLVRTEIPLEEVYVLLNTFYSLGASKLSILGGEPTLYGAKNYGVSMLPDVIEYAKKLGYSYVRIDTNGQFDKSLLQNNKFRMLDEISYSLDGYNEKTNDDVRGNGVFKKAISSINEAVKLGYNVNVTTCLYQELMEKNENGDYCFEQLIYLLSSLGVCRVNFHALIKDGTPIDTWSENLYVDPYLWLSIYEKISQNINNNKYSIPVRIPKSFITTEEFEKNKQYYGYCPVKLGERILIHPNGQLRICSALLCTPYCIAFYNNKHITWNSNMTNESASHKIDQDTVCTNRGKKDYNGLLPLCFSFKPNQNEYIWESKLMWENRKYVD